METLSKQEIAIAVAKYQKLKAYDQLFGARRDWVNAQIVAHYEATSGKTLADLKLEAKQMTLEELS